MNADEPTREVALQNAHQVLVDGPGDPRSVEGVKANALQSIAWSMIGLLARDATVPVTGVDEEETIARMVERALGTHELQR